MGDRKQAQSEVQVDTDVVRVTRWHFPPGTETGWHRHGYDYVVIPVTGGTLTVEDAEGSRPYPIEKGMSYARNAAVSHNIANDTDSDITFVEVELLDRAG
ncbi:cupin domain-containing protein [Zhengella sp. ZM62]|uniref:cupin domain-containing protein n=1 Tax=Zhengella sedimenti TaxID=3390035 RepID=UPI0039768D8F